MKKIPTIFPIPSFLRYFNYGSTTILYRDYLIIYYVTLPMLRGLGIFASDVAVSRQRARAARIFAVSTKERFESFVPFVPVKY